MVSQKPQLFILKHEVVKMTFFCNFYTLLDGMFMQHKKLFAALINCDLNM